MQREEVLTNVRTSDSATPIVPVLKQDGHVRICGGFKVKVYAATVPETYPVLRVEELLAMLSGGQRFTRLDLKNAYQQVELDIDSQRLATINAPQGLFRYTRLHFGVASAPDIYQ